MLTIKTYNYLPKDAIKIRNEVFVNEQGFREEFDTIDNECIHFIVFDKDKAIATTRIYFSIQHDCYSIGRFAVLKSYRQKGVGTFMIKEVEKYMKEKYGSIVIGLSSQLRAIAFYEKRGYEKKGDMYLDENYPHVWMEKHI